MYHMKTKNIRSFFYILLTRSFWLHLYIFFAVFDEKYGSEALQVKLSLSEYTIAVDPNIL